MAIGFVGAGSKPALAHAVVKGAKPVKALFQAKLISEVNPTEFRIIRMPG